MTQVAGDHPQAEPAFHPVLPVIPASAPAVIPSQARNAALDARAPAIPAPPGARVLQGLAFWRELAGGRDSYALDSGCLEALLRLCPVDPAISGYQVGWMLKQRAMVLHRHYGSAMLTAMLYDLEARHHAALHFIEDDVSAKLDQCATFVPGNGAGVRLEEAEHILLRGHLLALQHATACLSDHPLDQWQHLCRLTE